MSQRKHANAKGEMISDQPFHIVGIGASAGGLEALEQFFENVPAGVDLAFVVIQHLDPNHAGILPELLQRRTSIPVCQATDMQQVKPGCIYVIPPKKSLSIQNGFLHLFDPVEAHGLRLPIDIFFRSLAEDQQEKSIGIILSGMGSDGSLGLKAIKEKNGIVLVQEPKTAKFDSMPRSALDSVVVDITAPVYELPGRLVSFLRIKPESADSQLIEPKVKSNLDKIIILIREHVGHDFSLYKKSTLLRRIERRKNVHLILNIQDYIRYLQENPAEIEILYKELLIGVTGFFRDAPVWKVLGDKIIPELIERLPDGYNVRAWVPGCSTGEEAYSLAILFREALEKGHKHRELSLQLFATDLDNDAIEKARKGFFPKNIVSEISKERIGRFFTPDGEGFKLDNSIREMVVFAHQNVIKDPPFTKLDIIACRNLLIYFEPVLQQRLLSLFNYCLLPGGILILGTSETIGPLNEGFRDKDLKQKIYIRTDNNKKPAILDFPNTMSLIKKVSAKQMEPEKSIKNLQIHADQILIQRFSPASVMVNLKGDILYITGRTGKYLEPVAGKANWNIFAMAREGLRQVLPDAFRKAIANFEPVVVRNIKVGTNGGTQMIDLTVQQLDSPEALKGMVMVVFSDIQYSANVPGSIKEPGGKRSFDSHMLELENALQRSNDEIQSLRQEMQSSQEELQSANEELQSTNEELQSTNEELTTSKEEMQSLNEELQSVNMELQRRITDYIKANDDLKNLLNSTELGTLFLDKNLNIRRFTDPATHIFKLRPTDIDRPFTDITSNLQYPEIETHALNVLKTLVPVENAVLTIDGKWLNIRMMPYRTIDERIDGLVITFNDISTLKKLEIELKKANEVLTKNQLKQ